MEIESDKSGSDHPRGDERDEQGAMCVGRAPVGPREAGSRAPIGLSGYLEPRRKITNNEGHIDGHHGS